VSALAVAAAPASGIVVSSAVDQAQWDAFVSAHPEATGYHEWAWRHVFERAFSHRTEYLAAWRGRHIVGVLPLVLFDTWLFGTFMVSLPFVNYGGLLATDDESACELLEHGAALARARRATHVELRHRRRMAASLPVKRHKVAMIAPLTPDAAAMWAGFDRKVRNQIRKAEKSGLTVETHGVEAVDDFYRIFAENMRDLGTPVVTRRLFDEVLRSFPQRTWIFVVRDRWTAVAAGVGYGFRNTFEVPWAASLRAHKNTCPNHALYWAAIQHAIAEGYTRFDFGRSTPDEGTFHFKRQWGAQATPLCWEYQLLSRRELPDQSPENPKFQTAIAIWKRLPVRVATLIGPPIVRCIP
jgi:FemAB-related protein (PEP-CTERM system-associated)